MANRPLGEFRGANETGRFRWLAWHDATPVGYIDCGTADRWTTWEGGPHGRGVVATIPVPAGSIAYVVDPARRRRGYATRMIEALMSLPDLRQIELFAAGLEPDNVGSVACLQAAGFEPLDPRPDWEGIVYHVRFRPLGSQDRSANLVRTRRRAMTLQLRKAKRSRPGW